MNPSAPPPLCIHCGHLNPGGFERCERCERPAEDAVWSAVPRTSVLGRIAVALVLAAYVAGTAVSLRYLWGEMWRAGPLRAAVFGALIAFMVSSVGMAVSMARDALLVTAWTFSSRDGRARGVASTTVGRVDFARGGATERGLLDLQGVPGAGAMTSTAALSLPAHELAAAMPVPDEPAGEASEVSSAERAARQGAVVCALAGLAARGEVELLGETVSNWARFRDGRVQAGRPSLLVDVWVRAGRGAEVEQIAAARGPRLERALCEGLPRGLAGSEAESMVGAPAYRAAAPVASWPAVRASEAVAGALGAVGGVGPWVAEAGTQEGAAGTREGAAGDGAACAAALRRLFEARPEVARVLWRAASTGISVAEETSG